LLFRWFDFLITGHTGILYIFCIRSIRDAKLNLRAQMIPAGKVSKPNIRRITKVFCFPTAAGKKSYQVWGVF